MSRFFKGRGRLLYWGMIGLLAGCDSGGDTTSVSITNECTFPVGEMVAGCSGRDCIPSLTNPKMVDPGSTETDYLEPESRVIGVLLDGEPIAVPHNILWYHEIVNLDGLDSQIAVSYCPLTGSSITFDRAPFGGASFGVSGFLWRNNLVMYDRGTNETLWPQMLRQGGCGEAAGTPLTPVAASEMTWEGWQRLYPDTRVLSRATGIPRNYVEAAYPYGNYEAPDNASTLFPQAVNTDRPPKERVLGIPVDDGGKLYPFFELDTAAPVEVVNDVVDGRPVAVFWSDEVAGAVAFEAVLDGQPLTFAAAGNQFVDEDTGTVWDLQGRAVEGERAGAQLTPVAEAYVAFWFAWKAFHPAAEVWTASSGN